MMNKNLLEKCNLEIIDIDNISNKTEAEFVTRKLKFNFYSYKFHLEKDHREKYVSANFFTEYICSVIKIFTKFRIQADIFNNVLVVKYPLKNGVEFYSNCIEILGRIIQKTNKTFYVNIEKELVLDLIKILITATIGFEKYIIKNEIKYFVK